MEKIISKAEKIIISHAYSNDNKGDAALLGMLVQEVRREFNPTQLTILTMDKTRPSETFEGAPITSSFMYYTNYRYKNRGVKLFYGTFIMLSTLGWAYLYKHFKLDLPLPKKLKGLANQYKEADLIIPVGGGYLRGTRSLTSIYNLMLLLHPIVLSSILDKPTVLFTQSIGPFYRNSEIRILKHVLNKDVVLTILREDKSMKLLQENGIKKAVRSVDTGFLLKAKGKLNIRTRLNVPKKSKLIIGVTARKWLEASGQDQYETALAESLDYLIAKHDAYIVFIPQVTSTFHQDDDRVASAAIFKKMKFQGRALVLEENYDYYQIKALYDGLDFILGTRFHSVIFSLTSIVPALAIEYEYKTSGIMHDLNLEQWVIKIEDVTAKALERKMDQLIAKGEDYKAHVRRVLPAYIAKAHEAIELTKQAYDAFVAR